MFLKIVFCLLGLAGCSAAWAQQPTPPLPRTEYYSVFADYYSGEFESALKQLRSHSNGAFKDVDGYFLDSVCYWTMAAECYQRAGNYADAVQQYENALNLYSGLQGWPNRIQGLQAGILEDTGATRRAAAVTWGKSTRGARYGKFDNAMLILLGKTDAQNEKAFREGGIVDFQRMRKIDMAEVMRCVSLAIYRRQRIKGPVSKIDPFTRQISTSLVGQGGATIPAAWQGVARGMALASMEDWANAQTVLTNSLQIGGFDHPLTPIALLVLGHISANQLNWAEASRLYMEASIAAVAYEQPDIVEEALHYAATIHSAQRVKEPFAPLVDVAVWAKREKVDPLLASTLVDAAIIASELGDIKAATDALNQSSQAMRGNDISSSAINTRWMYASAINAYMDRNVVDGDKAFADFLAHAQGTSRWLYQIALSDAAVRGNGVTERDAELLYAALLSEPLETDWLFRPDETMAFISTPHYQSLENWFTVALSRKAEEKAIEIAELVRRQRFFSALPMGGRLVALRWILEAPDVALTETAKKQKQALLIRYPSYKELSDKAIAVQAALEKLPLDPETGSPERVEQKKLFEQLAELTSEQELFIRQIALLRDPSELAFPRPLSVPEIQKAIPAEQLMVLFLKIGEVYHVMTLGNGRYSMEGAIPARDFDRKVAEILKKVSVGEKSAVYDADEFTNEEWKTTAREISAMIFQKSTPDSLAEIRELIIVPDGMAWYLPFELLQKGAGEQTSNLIDDVRIRYAPMASLGVPDGRTNRRFQVRALVAQRNFNRDKPEMIESGSEKIRGAMPNLQPVSRLLQFPSSYVSPLLDQLFIWHDHKDKGSDRDGVFGMSPMQIDDGKPGSNLGDWMALPWRGVDQFVWTGLSSDIEGSTRTRADGSDLFFTSTALMASGVRTILLSRWRVGGKSTMDLTHEFAIELNRQPASAAWQRSVKLFREADLDLASEPRVRPVEMAEPLTGNAPFFWSGYLLIDSGWTPGPAAEGTTDSNSNTPSEDG